MSVKDQVSVKNDITRENDDTGYSKNNLCGVAWEEHANNARYKQNPDTSKQSELIQVLALSSTWFISVYITYIGPIPLKSHLDWKVKRVKAKKTDNVMSSAWNTTA
jgi:hypothetical protein